MFNKKSLRQFTSKREAYSAFFSYFFAPYLFAGVGLYFVVWTRDNLSEVLSYEHAKHTIYLVVLLSILVLIYSWVKAFRILFVIMGTEGDKLPDIPETVTCLNCREPFLGSKVKELKCPKCGGILENLAGFYERHPELKEDR